MYTHTYHWSTNFPKSYNRDNVLGKNNLHSHVVCHLYQTLIILPRLWPQQQMTSPLQCLPKTHRPSTAHHSSPPSFRPTGVLEYNESIRPYRKYLACHACWPLPHDIAWIAVVVHLHRIVHCLALAHSLEALQVLQALEQIQVALSRVHRRNRCRQRSGHITHTPPWRNLRRIYGGVVEANLVAKVKAVNDCAAIKEGPLEEVAVIDNNDLWGGIHKLIGEPAYQYLGQFVDHNIRAGILWCVVCTQL